jgi:hypothetical protein
MGSLRSKQFTKPAEDVKLEACLVSDPAHIMRGAKGDHVKKIQDALNQLSTAGLVLDGCYGQKTAAAVKAYKDAPSRKILQPWQTSADDIVGRRTIKSLDDEMFDLENQTSQYVSLTSLGSPHDHSKCPLEADKKTRINHLATPINPRGSGRKINMGGEGETKYLGFEDFAPDAAANAAGPKDRPLTPTLPDRCASDICFRNAHLGRSDKKEIVRIAQPKCRLTFASHPKAVQEYKPFLLRLGRLLEERTIKKDNHEYQVLVIEMT